MPAYLNGLGAFLPNKPIHNKKIESSRILKANLIREPGVVQGEYPGLLYGPELSGIRVILNRCVGLDQFFVADDKRHAPPCHIECF